MISGLRGSLHAVDALADGGAEVMVDVAGVGYEVLVGARLATALPAIGREVELAVYTHVREGAITLFGFADRAERRLFSLLIGAHGIGPALALAILGALSPSELVRAVTDGDQAALMVVPGVGRKTAQRLVIELAERFGVFDVPTGATSLAPPADTELRAALSALGYGPEDIRAALANIPHSGEIEARLRLALRELAPTPAGR